MDEENILSDLNIEIFVYFKIYVNIFCFRGILFEILIGKKLVKKEFYIEIFYYLIDE